MKKSILLALSLLSTSAVAAITPLPSPGGVVITYPNSIYDMFDPGNCVDETKVIDFDTRWEFYLKDCFSSPSLVRTWPPVDDSIPETAVAGLIGDIDHLQPESEVLYLLAANPPPRDAIFYFDELAAAHPTDFTATARSLLAETSTAGFRSGLGLGTSSVLDAPSSGNATSGQTVKGNDTRLSDARTPTAHNHGASDINSGTFADARVAQSNVTQHQSALSLTASQITDFASTVRATVLTGLSTASATVISATDNVLIAAGKLQAQISANATAIAGKFDQPTGTTAQYLRGDGSPATFVTDARAAFSAGSGINISSGVISLNSRTFNYPSRALNSCFQISSTNNADFHYKVDVSSGAVLSGTVTGTVTATSYTNSGCTTGAQVVSDGTASQGAALGLLSVSQIAPVGIDGTLPGGLWMKITTANTAGTPSFAIRAVQAEVILP